MKKIISALVVLALIFSFSAAAFAGGSQESGVPYIAVVSKGEQHDFWQQVRRGSEDAAKEYGVDVTFEGPPSESDVQDQVQMLNNALAKDPVAIAFAALDTTSVTDQLTQARDSDIPIIGFDSGVPNAPAGSIHANASTDNFAAAGLAAEHMFEVIKGDIEAATSANPVTVAVINQDAAGESLLSRGKGFRNRMVELIIANTSMSAGDIKVMGNPAYVDSSNPTGGDKVFIDMVVPASSSAQDVTSAASALLNRVNDDNILGIFASNEGTAKGILAATNDGADLSSGAAHDGLVVIGFDAGAGQKAAVRNGYFLGSITQDPYSIGFKAVELAYKAYKGESVSDIDTGAKFYDSSNMNDADIAPLLYD
jgi:ribose transport system substrate-binding protein